MVMAGHGDIKNGGTFDYQTKLPSLPVPSLEQTCEKYLQSVRPLVNDDEYTETEHRTNIFRDGVGRYLHNKLEKMASNSRNWLADMWYGTYLDYRGPLPVISNLGGGTSTNYFYPEKGSQYERAALWLHFGTLKFLEIIRQELPLQKLGRKYPMDMVQYLDLFCGGRIPGEKRDVVAHYITYTAKRDGTFEVTCNVKHVIILMKGRIFKLNVFDKEGYPLLPPAIERQLLKIVDFCEKDGDGDGVGSLTAADRDTYYKAYRHLCMLDKQNKVNVNIINEAILGFAFDDIETFGLQDSMEHAVLGECKNRWFDKTVVGIIGTTGMVASNHDHVHYDGNASTSVMKQIRTSILEIGGKWEGEYKPQPMEDPVEVKFIVDDYILNVIQETQIKHNMLVSKLEIIDQPIKGYGKDFAKLHKINPDTLVQMAIQLGYYTLHKKCVSTYESGTTRMFYHGRTETVRSCTCESKAWVESMCNKNANQSAMIKLFWEAVDAHNTLMLDACQGQGIDRYLFGLKKIAELEGIPMPTIFTDKSWTLSGGDGSFILSTSLSGFHEVHGAMAPINFDGYGTFYTIDNEWVYITVSAWKDSSETDVPAFYNSIVTAFDTIRNLLSVQPKL